MSGLQCLDHHIFLRLEGWNVTYFTLFETDIMIGLDVILLYCAVLCFAWLGLHVVGSL